LATDPDMSSKDLAKAVGKKGIDVAVKKNAINTAYSQFGKVVKELRKNKKMK
jgi:hypothetical protein